MIELNQNSVAAHRAILENPAEHGFPFRPIRQCFEQSEEVTANHILFRDFHEEVPMLHKLFFYIVMQEIFGPPNRKDKEGHLGYHLTFKPAS